MTFICLLNKYLLSMYSVPVNVLSSEDVTVKGKEKVPEFMSREERLDCKAVIYRGTNDRNVRPKKKGVDFGAEHWEIFLCNSLNYKARSDGAAFLGWC